MPLELNYGSVTSLKSIRITHEKTTRIFIVTRLMVVIPLQIDHNASPPQCLLPNTQKVAEGCGMYVVGKLAQDSGEKVENNRDVK